MKRYTLMAAALLALFSFTACEKVIEIDLNETNPTLVVEAQVSNQPGVPHFVSLSQTVSYFNPSAPPPVNNAVVTLADDQGNEEQLEVSLLQNGLYTSSVLEGVPGRTYTLTIEHEGETYTAQSTMPEPVAIDSLRPERRPGGGFGPADPDAWLVYYHFQEPEAEDNYYRYWPVTPGEAAFGGAFIYVQDDRITNGNQIEFPLFGDTFRPGQEVILELWSLDEATYRYYDTLSDVIGGGGLGETTPSNPTSNISNGALGYFGAIAKTSARTVIPQ